MHQSVVLLTYEEKAPKESGGRKKRESEVGESLIPPLDISINSYLSACPQQQQQQLWRKYTVVQRIEHVTHKV